MHKKSVVALVSVFALASLTACGSQAAGSTDSPQSGDSSSTTGDTTGDKGVLTVGGTGVSYPQSYVENDELVGFDTEVIAAAAERAGYTVEFTTMDFPGLLGAVSSGKIDTTATNLTWTPERAAVYVFSSAYAFDGVGLSVQKDNDAINTPEDLYGKVIATGAGTTNEAAVTAWNEATGANAEIRTYDTSQSALQDVLLGRADGQAAPRGGTIANIENRGLELKVIGDLLTFEQTRFPFADTERGRQLATDISAAIAELQADGTLAELSNKYFTYDRTVGGEEFNTPDPTQLSLPEDFADAAASATPSAA